VRVLLLVGVALVWLPSLATVFQFDDYNVIVQAAAVHSWEGLGGDLGRGLRPVLKASYTANWTSGLGEPGFHAFNVLVHLVNVVLVFAIGLRLSARWGVHGAGAPLAAALVFALHPVQTEAVTYISGRSSSLAAAFYLGSLLVYLRGGHWLVSCALFALAVGTKETALTLPAALLLCELCARDRLPWREIFKRQLPQWLAFFILGTILLVQPRYHYLLDVALAQRSIADNLVTQVQGVGYLAWQLVAPWHLNIDPALPALTAWDAGTVAQGLLFIVLLGIGLLNLRNRPWLGFGILWFFLQLAPTNSLVPRLDVANDRQLYLALWGVVVALAFQVRASGIPLRFARGALVIVLVALAIVAVDRQLDYRSEIALWSASVREAPWNARAWNNLGVAYAEQGDRKKALEAYSAALSLGTADYRPAFNASAAKRSLNCGCEP
jgi:tetratricopeptide (TPR) repeat protein